MYHNDKQLYNNVYKPRKRNTYSACDRPIKGVQKDPKRILTT